MVFAVVMRSIERKNVPNSPFLQGRFSDGDEKESTVLKRSLLGRIFFWSRGFFPTRERALRKGGEGGGWRGIILASFISKRSKAGERDMCVLRRSEIGFLLFSSLFFRMLLFLFSPLPSLPAFLLTQRRKLGILFNPFPRKNQRKSFAHTIDKTREHRR